MDSVVYCRTVLTLLHPLHVYTRLQSEWVLCVVTVFAQHPLILSNATYDPSCSFQREREHPLIEVSFAALDYKKYIYLAIPFSEHFMTICGKFPTNKLPSLVLRLGSYAALHSI